MSEADESNTTNGNTCRSTKVPWILVGILCLVLVLFGIFIIVKKVNGTDVLNLGSVYCPKPDNSSPPTSASQLSPTGTPKPCPTCDSCPTCDPCPPPRVTFINGEEVLCPTPTSCPTCQPLPTPVVDNFDLTVSSDLNQAKCPRMRINGGDWNTTTEWSVYDMNTYNMRNGLSGTKLIPCWQINNSPKNGYDGLMLVKYNVQTGDTSGISYIAGQKPPDKIELPTGIFWTRQWVDLRHTHGVQHWIYARRVEPYRPNKVITDLKITGPKERELQKKYSGSGWKLLDVKLNWGDSNYYLWVKSIGDVPVGILRNYDKTDANGNSTAYLENPVGATVWTMDRLKSFYQSA
jgi:hypothetical protein